jgi:hypothetical protein
MYQVVRDQSTGQWTQKGSKYVKSRPYPGASLVLPLTGLEPGTLYKVELRARNVVGYSHPGVTVFRTADSYGQYAQRFESLWFTVKAI